MSYDASVARKRGAFKRIRILTRPLGLLRKRKVHKLEGLLCDGLQGENPIEKVWKKSKSSVRIVNIP